MKSHLRVVGLLTVISAGMSACGFESSRTVLAPTTNGNSGGAPTPVPNGGAGSLTGSWASSPLDFPASWSCGDFKWNVTSQTATSIAGDIHAVCAGVVTVTATASGQMTSSNDMTMAANGTALIQNVIPCTFALKGTGRLENPDTLHINYSGDTCLGPVQGQETLRRPKPDEPEPPPPPPPPPPAGNPYHVADGPLSFDRAEQVVYATGREFPHLPAPHPSDGEAIRAAEELLLRIIWHLELAGYNAARQRNPSGAISNDKLNIFIAGQWHAYDLFMDYGVANQEMQLIFLPITAENPIEYPGIPD
jgi:hypothetical protein